MQVDHNRLGDLAVLMETAQMARRLVAAQDVVRQALHHCPDLCVSISGGKDSVAAALIARSVSPSIPLVIAHPPNALPYRADHVRDLKAYFSGPWIDAPYDWEVDRVMDGLARYPAGLKVRTLVGLERPGYVLGLRVAESRARQIAYRKHGPVYRTATGWRCLPVARWTAEEVIALAVYYGAPIAEVYRLPLLGMQLDDIRDGTWWAHRTDMGADDWMRRNYPSCHALWERSAEIELAARRSEF